MCNLIKQTEPVISYPTGSIIKVKTIFEKPTRKMNLAKLDSSKLISLKTKDPFMYYSIDFVRYAAVHHRPVDVSAFDARAKTSASQSRRQKRSGDSKDEVSNIVTRKSRISYEVYHDLFAEDAPDDDFTGLMDAENDEFDFDSFVASFEIEE
ncbi:hypothetical protein ACHAWO_006951 [Cyclotella atomus]|uniref:Uncharacterized protein n=1 Tax=Cyclotella atomus TaxID=382360 RepID=A0ABD3Q5I9_9STRA